MRAIADEIPALDTPADILLLLGQDILQVHKVGKQYNRPHNAMFAQKHDLGWIIVGDICLSGAHPKGGNTFKTRFMENGHPSYMCPFELVRIKADFS